MAIPERTKEGYEKLRRLLEMNPEGLPLRRAVEETRLAYPSIKNKLEEWGYRLEKGPVMVQRIENIIKKIKKKVE